MSNVERAVEINQDGRAFRRVAARLRFIVGLKTVSIGPNPANVINLSITYLILLVNGTPSSVLCQFHVFQLQFIH